MMFYYLLFSLAFVQNTNLDSPVGYWKTIDDQSGEARSIVEVYQEGGLLYGAVMDLLQEDDDTLCGACKGADHNKPIVGLKFIQGLNLEDGRWSGGRILDPETGNTYKCILWLEEDGKQLKVRGKHWTGLYRTQTWFRTEAP